MNNERVFAMTFASIYPLYLAKVERKGKTKDELDTVLCWLTGFDAAGLADAAASDWTLQEFFERIPELNPAASEIKGVICGYRVEDIEDPLMQKIRYMDKVVDELARGKEMENILRKS
ncbi:DUF2200 domain-containing protein [Corynebacterium sp. H130]|uniref:DUF2200 domain-containing protein n=1 Tax=Corynebacterium sp. H130 TaxID=3133444 RepID=UPI0030A7F740